ncbi:MAG: GHKL domain-containing protein [Sporocytophaga sp.]|uniref:ATP-binding protein n=1 Tax=Sporocytophaga sp. TaxID=2231183 RepID=UPI001B0796D6|nr:ATP-binding protein [Sporocytophaga sp.]MBO9699841.1 GHKL domain-containing protein [Sporocytophaga sp.]
MRKIVLIAFLISLIGSIGYVYALPVDSVKVVVIDEKDKPVSAAKVSIEGSRFFLTNKSGIFKFRPAKELEMPIKVVLDKAGFVIDEFIFYEEDKEIEIRVKKNEYFLKELVVKLLNDSGSVMASHILEYAGEEYHTDKKGIARIPKKRFVPEDFIVDGYNLDKINFAEKEQIYVLTLKPEVVEQPKTILADNTKDTMTIETIMTLTQEQLDSLIFDQYKEEFEKISAEIVEERRRLVESNTKIRDEIDHITNKLRNEKNLTDEQRQELQKYVGKLERSLIENSLAYNKAEEKTMSFIERLKFIIMQKDSINYIAIKKLQAAERQRIQAEKKAKRTIIISSIIAVALLLLAVVFYSIARKMRRQKRQLEISNEELGKIKDTLSEKLIESDKQKAMIEEQNQQLDMFVYKASHDIKGPLKSLLGLSKLGLTSVKDENSLELFTHIHKSITKLDKLVSDLLFLSKAKKVEINNSKINVGGLVQEVVNSYKNIEGYGNVNIDIDIPDTIDFTSDYNLFYSVVQNFVENAIKYADNSKGDKYLKISASSDDEKTEFRFEDNGMGIEPEHLPKIFDMFYKISENSAGSGLGLYIVKYNVERLGGIIKVESELNKGSVFVLEFKKTAELVLN